MFPMRIAFGLTIALLALAQGECWNYPSTLRCSNNYPVTVVRGTCVLINNPCGDNVWSAGDTFQLDDPFGDSPGITVRPNRFQSFTTREICAALDTPVEHESLNFKYQLGTQWGAAVIDLTVTDEGSLAASASANPATINLGETSQILATVSGGRPPYSYDWVPRGTLNDSTIANPIATPALTTTYAVTVTDDRGNQITAIVIVNVNAPTPTPTPASTGADLAVTLSDSADPVPTIGPLMYTFLVTNNGPLTATNVRMSCPLPLGTELGSNFFPSQGTCVLSLTNILTCNFGALASGTSATLPLPIFSLSLGTMTSTVTVTANESDPNPTNNLDTETTTIVP